MGFSLRKLLTTSPASVAVGVAKRVASTPPPKIPNNPVSATVGLVRNNPTVKNIVNNRPAIQTNVNRAIKQTGVNIAQSKAVNPYTKHLVGANLGTGRAIVGQAEGLSGVYDLVTPGSGTNRFTQATRRAGARFDDLATKAGVRGKSYTAGQVGTDLASFLVPGAVLSKAPKGLNVLSKAPKIVSKVAPVVANVGADTLQGAGQRTARGQDNSLKTAGMDAGLSLATAGVLAGGSKVISKTAPKIARAVTNAVADKRLTDADVSALLKIKQGRGGFMNDADYLRAQESVQKAGIDTSKPESWSQIDKIIADYNQVLEGRGDPSKFNMGQSRFKPTPLNQGGYVDPKAMIDDAKRAITPPPTAVDPMQKVFDQNPMNMTRQQVSKQVKQQVQNGELVPNVNIKQRGKEKAIKVERIPVNIKAIDPERVKDINGLESQAQDLWRNTEKVFGKNSEIGNTILRPLDDAKGRFIDDQDNYAGQLKETIVDGLKIKKGSKESASVQEFGEGAKTYEQLIDEFGQPKADTIVQADKWFRKAYDQILDEVNAQRMRIYNGNPDKVIPKRKDYYRHFTEMQDGFQGLLNIFETPAGISSSLAGISQNTKPKSKWLSFAQQRMGNKTDVDAVGGFLDYLRASSYAKNIDPEIARIRKFREALADQTATGKEAGKINTYLEFLDDYANDLAGKTNPADRFVQKITGRKAMGVLNWVNKRAKSNAILGNFSSSVAQVFGVPLGLGDVQSPKAIYDGSKDYFKSISGGKTAIDQSTFIKERYANIYDQFDEGIIKNSKKFAAWMVGVGDEVATKWIWHAQHNKALEQGIKGADAIRFADGRTRAVVAGRGVGEVPLLQKSKVFQMVAPFQLEVGNQWLVFKDWKGEGSAKLIKGLITYSIAAGIMNKGAEQIRGNDVAFDPLDAMADAWRELTTDEVDSEGNAPSVKERVTKAGGRLGGEVLGNLPGGAYVGQLAVPNEFKRKEIFGNEDPSRFGTSPLAVTNTVGAVGDILDRPKDWRAYSKAVTGLVTPFAGKQVDRSLNAVVDQARGFTTSAKGKAKFATEENPIRRGQAILFGSNSTPNARSYYNQEEKPLSDKQNEKLNALPKEEQKGFIESIMNRRNKVSASPNTLQSIEDKEAKLKEDFEAQFSEDDYKILGYDKKRRQEVIDAGIKSKKDIDGLDRYALNKRKELGMPAGELGAKQIPDDIDNTDDKVKSFYSDRSYVYQDDYETWQSQAPDTDAGKDMIRRVNQMRPEGFPELPNNNLIAEMYADFKAKESKGNWSKLRDNEERKKFLRSAYKTALTEEQKFADDLGTDKLISAIDNGDVNADVIRGMVELDNQLIKLGATAMLSKTVRGRYGLGYATTSSGTSGGSGKTKKISDSVFNLTDISSARSRNRNALRSILKSAKL